MFTSVFSYFDDYGYILDEEGKSLLDAFLQGIDTCTNRGFTNIFKGRLGNIKLLSFCLNSLSFKQEFASSIICFF